MVNLPPTSPANSFALDSRPLEALRRQAGSDPAAAAREAASQFESILLKLVLKNLRTSVLADPTFSSNQSMFYTDLLDQQLSQSLAANGGFGLADYLTRAIERQLPTARPDGDGRVSPEDMTALQPGPAAAPGTNPPFVSADGGRFASPRDFVDRLWPHAVAISRETGIEPRFMIAHAALETGWGQREIRSADGGNSHNLFGIKAGRSWQGDTVDITTTEYINGRPEKRVETFRAYDSFTDAFRDYARLLQNRYGEAVAAGSDPEGFARGLARGGYATDPMYADKLARVINGRTLREALMG